MGTPVILLKKPDTSEQWIINSTVSLEPYVEVEKEKEFNVNFTSNNMSYNRIMLGGPAHLIMYGDPIINAGSGGSMQDAYRQITLEKPATGELKTWLEANAVRLPLTGTWVFNEKLTAANPPLRTDIAFTSNGTEFTSINTGGGGNVMEPTKSYPLFYNDTKVNNDSAYSGKWVNQAYRTITFTQPVQYQGNEEFVRWFVDNAVPAEGGVSFKLNDTIALSIQRQNVSWTSDRAAKVPSYYCTPYFINNFRIGDKSYTYFGAHKDATIFRTYRQANGATAYDTVAGLTMYLNILPDESFYS